jgi:mycobactin salicyl-AMP ligase
MTPAITLPRLVSPWNGLTISKLVESASRTRCNDIAFVDAPDTSIWLHRPARSLNYKALREQTHLFARQLTTLGLKRGETVMLLLPNAVEFPIACLGAMLAGFVPVPVSIALSFEQLRQVAERTHAKAIITVAHVLDVELANRARDIAAQVFSIKAVASFGENIPDGVVSLDNWDEVDLAPLNESAALNIDDKSLINVEFIGKTPRALARTQGQIMAETIALSSTAQIDSKSSIINTILPSSAFSFISSIALPIISRAQMHFHGLFSSKTLIQQIKAIQHIKTCSNAILIAPLAAEEGLAELSEDIQKGLNRCILLRRLEKNLNPQTTFLPIPVIDVTAIGDAAHLCIPRKSKDMRGALPQNWRQPGMRVVESDILLVKTRIDAENRLSLSGFGVASLSDAPLGSAIEGGLTTEFYAQNGEGQTFIPFEMMTDFVEPVTGKQSAA